MELDEYQELCRRTAGSFPEEERVHWILITAIGLAGESGEILEVLKKVYGHGHELDLMKLKKEVGDLLWYISDILSKHNISLDEVASLNIEKLKLRYPEGFDKEKSKNRAKEDT